jgi:hypothetical protein
MTIIEAMSDESLFAPMFAGESWRAWRVFLAALFALPLDAVALDVYRKHTGRTSAPTQPAREAWVVAGRRAGKSRIAALVATFVACFGDHARSLARGERGIVLCIASDRAQARVVFGYVRALLESVPLLAAMVESTTAWQTRLTNGIAIEIHTASFRAVRGYSIIAAILDEVAFWPRKARSPLARRSTR